MRLQKITGQRHDPCVWDVFAAIIHEARTGIKQPWWEWTAVRKKRQKEELNKMIDVGLRQLDAGLKVDPKKAFIRIRQKIKSLAKSSQK